MDRVKVLIVDDVEQNRIAMHAILKKIEDIDIVIADSGNSALAALLEDEFAVVLLDVQMPEMDGFETAKLLRQGQLNANVPIIFVTAISKEEQHVLKGYDNGAVDYLFKPVDPYIVLSKVNVFITLAKQKIALQKLNADLHRSNEELEKYAYAVAHDLQEPLSVIQSFLKLIKRRYVGRVDGDFDEFLHYCLGGSERLRNLIKDVVEYSKLVRPDNFQNEVNLNLIVKEALSNLGLPNESVQINTMSLPALRCDPRSMVRVFQNLIQNAVKFKSSGTVNIEVGVEKKPDGDVIYVKDDGIGIDSRYSKRIFHLFGTAHGKGNYSGTGIGLAVCKSIIEYNNGRMWFESEPGRGTTFYFSFGRRLKDVA